MIDQALAQSEQRHRWFCEVNHVPALVSRIEAGLGIGVLPRMALPPDDGLGKLRAIRLTDPQITRMLGLISRRGKPLAPAAQLFYDLLIGGLVERKARRCEPALALTRMHEVCAFGHFCLRASTTAMVVL